MKNKGAVFCRELEEKMNEVLIYDIQQKRMKKIPIYGTICYDKAEKHLPQKHIKVA